MRVLVLVPTRLKRDRAQRLFLESALRSIAAQQLPAEPGIRIEVSIGVDPGAAIPGDLLLPSNATVAEATGASQACALNAAAARFDHDVLAILEDDDQWRPDFLHVSLAAMQRHRLDFVSTTQLQVDDAGRILGINDFPIPSGWVMRRSAWEAVGPFDVSYRFHLDNEWLGRLALRGGRRAHLLESTAPIDPDWMDVRPWLRSFVECAGPNAGLLRHADPVPLVIRAVHGGSGMAMLRKDPTAQMVGRQEYERLFAAFGRVPW